MMKNDEIYKQFENVFKDKTFSLPIQRDDNDFLTNLDDVLGEYQARISAERLSDYSLTKINKICKELSEIVKLYYSGSSARSFKKFEELMKDLDRYLVTINKVINSRKTEDIPRLYRTRVVNVNRKYKKKDIFHVPFSLRTIIGNARYSLAGYPCLYLSTTLNLCHFESNGKNNSLKIFSRFEAEYDGINEIVILDMSKKPKNFLIEIAKNNVSTDKLEEYYYIFPILVASSFIKPIQEQKFVPEYIIPQFLLE